jgi:hypothetical protein
LAERARRRRKVLGAGRKRRAAVAWEVKKMVELAEKENQKRGGPAKRRLGEEIDLGFCFCVVSPLKYQNFPPFMCVEGCYI